MTCCPPPSVSFWRIWYFWFLIFFMVFFCTLTGWWCKARTHNNSMTRRGPDIRALTNYLHRWQRTNNRNLLNQPQHQYPGSVSAALHDHQAPAAASMTAPAAGPAVQDANRGGPIAAGLHPAPVVYNYRASANPMYPFHPADYLGLRNDPRYGAEASADTRPGIQLNIPSGIDVNSINNRSKSLAVTHTENLQDSLDYYSSTWDAISSKKAAEQHAMQPAAPTTRLGQSEAVRKKSSPEIMAPPMLPPGAVAGIEDAEDEDSVDYHSQQTAVQPSHQPSNMAHQPSNVEQNSNSHRRSDHVGELGLERKSSQRITLPPIYRA